MADPRPLTLRDLRGLTPRALENLAAERGVVLPRRATSADVRIALIEGSGGRTGTVTTEALPPPPATRPANRAEAFEGLPMGTLRQLAKQRGLKVKGRTKQAFVDALAAT